ncbi:hypothetical protein MLD38_001127 [Melastoma candidum]|uniref:Uncharacterized protein n=1 Tax=Melastoma candidum TaxID=119954 RepID=A0ACB9SH51_9MYRT|nr:hypothetical protein MLD38_001127 [Melastoma candidum]
MNFAFSSIRPASQAATHAPQRSESPASISWEGDVVAVTCIGNQRRIRNRNYKQEKPRCHRIAVTVCSLELHLLPFSVNEVMDECDMVVVAKRRFILDHLRSSRELSYVQSS